MRARARAESSHDVDGIDARWPGTRVAPCFSTVPAFRQGRWASVVRLHVRSLDWHCFNIRERLQVCVDKFVK